MISLIAVSCSACGFVIPDVTRGTLHGAIHANVEPGSKVYTDAWHCYTGLVSYAHHVVNHDGEYTRGHIHTNNIENFWSLLRRSLRGTYIAARPFRLTRYVDEQAFRFNTRDMKDGDRFEECAKRADGCRITYAQLTSANPVTKTLGVSSARASVVRRRPNQRVR